jgi:hypothetical protein
MWKLKASREFPDTPASWLRFYSSVLGLMKNIFPLLQLSLLFLTPPFIKLASPGVPLGKVSAVRQEARNLTNG